MSSKTDAMTEAQSKGPSAVVRYWNNEITEARSRDKTYRKEGERIRRIYSGVDKDKIPFNILYSNTETMLPALYSSTPKPIVQRRFKDADPIGRAASMAGQRALEFLLDTNVDGYETFDGTMRDVVLDGLLPGRGVSRVKYEVEIDSQPQDGIDEAGNPLPPIETKKWESAVAESVAWDRVYFGYATKWTKVPWVAFEHYLDKDEATRMFGAEVAERMDFVAGNETKRGEEYDGQRKVDDENQDKEKKTCLVYEIWKKKGRKVCFIAPTYQHGYLKETEDPLQLTGFFPIPKPMVFLNKTADLNPIALYQLYENQATELNRISTRINRIVEAVKVRGAYDGSLGDTLGEILKQDDNVMTPTSNASNIRLEGGIDKYIWFMPLESLIRVLQQLIIARNECKQVIYEVTGIADILRGASDANETLGAQQIKNQWASMRIKMLQKEVMRYTRDMLRMMLEIAAKHFSPDTFAQMTGLPFTTEQQVMQAQAMEQAAQMAGQQPPPQTMQVLQAPNWERVLELLKNDLQRAYRIDIETNSTIEANEQEDKQNITEALTAMGQFIQGVTPLVEQGVMPFEAAKSMLLAIVRKFRFGTEVEEEIKSMQPPQPKQDNAAQAEQAKAQADMAIEQQKAKLTAQEMQMEAQFKAAEHQQRMAELEAKGRYNLMMAQIKEKEAMMRMAEMGMQSVDEENAAIPA